MNNPISVTEENYTTLINIKLWNPKRFIIIGMLFSFFAVAVLYSINYYRLGYKSKGYKKVLIFAAIFALVIALTSYIPNNISKYIFIGLNAYFVLYMQTDQNEPYMKHIENGGKTASYLFPSIIFTFFTGLLIWAMIYTGDIPDYSIAFQDDELYYTERIKREEAEKLGNYLVSIDVFEKDNKTINLGLDRNKNGYILSILVNESAVNNFESIEAFKELGKEISAEILNNEYVQINLCDDKFHVIKELKP